MASDEPLRVFISYARNDDHTPVEGEGRGFVTTLVKFLEHRLEYELRRPPVVEIWRDRGAIIPSDQFGPKIEAGINAADVLLVVLSDHWLKSKWCARELELFNSRFPPAEAKHRIIVVTKESVASDERPEPLKGQEGYRFARRDKDSPGGLYEYFALGKPRLPEFQDVIIALALDIWGRACTKGNVKPPLVAETPENGTLGRTIFVARPAPDMKSSFERVVQELCDRGYDVVPDPAREIPQDESATAFFDEALGSAESAVHLLGEKAGFSPEELPAIATLQLQRSANRVASSTTFKRLIWAPAEFMGLPRRDSIEVLRRFGPKMDSDKVDDSDLSSFVDFIVKHLHENAPESATAKHALPEDARVYVYHKREDTEYARSVARALQKRNMEIAMPIFDADDAVARRWHANLLKSCDAVLVCWANADEGFTFSMIDEWSDWKTLGRGNDFAKRAVVVGPPRNERKEVLIEFPPRPQVDIVIDLTGVDQPGPDAFGSFVSATA